MAFVEDVHEDDLPEICAADRAQAGYLPNYSRVWAHRPEAYAAWKQLAGAIKSSTDKRRYELATLAAARRLRSSYCALAHGKVLADRFHDATDVAAFASDHRTAGLNEVDVAVMDFAEKVADDATAVTGRTSTSPAGRTQRCGCRRHRSHCRRPLLLQQDAGRARRRARLGLPGPRPGPSGRAHGRTPDRRTLIVHPGHPSPPPAAILARTFARVCADFVPRSGRPRVRCRP
jgi:alkylhydroperoxidase family enzyme